MANEPNTPDHRWYERRNNIALSNEDLSRETIFDSGIQKINSWINSQPWGFDYPQLVLDFDDEYYRVDGGDTTFASAITHTRASTATYVDSTGTLQTAAINEPRLGHHVWNGTAWVNEGLLHESEARTNLVTYSEEFDNAVFWPVVRASVTANDAAGPDGASTADRFVEDSATGTHQATAVITVTADTVHTVSLYVKEGSGSVRALRIDFTESSFSDGFRVLFNPSTGEIVTSQTFGAGSGFSTSVQDAGNGWYRVSLTGKLNAVATSARLLLFMQSNLTAFSASYTGDGSSNLLLWGAQLEAAPTPSSYIPTSGSTVTRSADVLTIPAANLPYPEPVVIGPEIAVGTPDTLGSDWTDNGDGSYTSSGALTSGQLTLAWNNAAITSGKVFRVSGTISGRTQGALGVKLGGGATIPFTTNTDFDLILANGTVGNVQFIELSNAGLGFDGTIDNISVREINPLALSIQMDGKITYADEDNTSTAVFFLWQQDANNTINYRLRTNLGTGEIQFNQIASGVLDERRSNSSEYAPDVLVPFNIAGRHGSTFINGAVDGVALTADLTPVALPDLSASNLLLGNDYNGTIRTFRVWGQDVGNAGIAEATT